MITVEICSVALDCSYDFRVDEFAEIEAVIEEIVQMFCRKEQCEAMEDCPEAVLYSKKAGHIFSGENCLNDYGVKTGDQLFLV
ncbi:MAG: hypothetical protein ACI4JA_07720 [Oscillospiraceae bacterium]